MGVSGCFLKVMAEKLPIFPDLYTFYIQLLRGGLWIVRSLGREKKTLAYYRMVLNRKSHCIFYCCLFICVMLESEHPLLSRFGLLIDCTSLPVWEGKVQIKLISLPSFFSSGRIFFYATAVLICSLKTVSMKPVFLSANRQLMAKHRMSLWIG